MYGSCSTKLITSLEQHNVDIIKMSPDRSKIRYSVVKASRYLLASFGWLINELQQHKESTPKTLVFADPLMHVASYFNYLYVNCRKLHTLALKVERKVFKSDCLPCIMPKLTKRTAHCALSASAGSALVELYFVQLPFEWALTFQIYTV